LAPDDAAVFADYELQLAGEIIFHGAARLSRENQTAEQENGYLDL